MLPAFRSSLQSDFRIDPNGWYWTQETSIHLTTLFFVRTLKLASVQQFCDFVVVQDIIATNGWLP
jgi:hypothetical protein